MVLCIVALVVFAVLGIFSAKYREYAREAFGCVTRTVMLRPCDTGFDTKIKVKITSKLSRLSPKLGQSVFKHYAFVSMFFAVLFFGSMGYSAFSLYNYFAFGNCNGPESSAFCAINALTGKTELKKPLNFDGLAYGDPSAPNVLIEYGCFTCFYTRQSEHGLKAFIANRSDVYYVLKPFPVLSHNNSYEAVQAAFCADEQGKFGAFRPLLFDNQDVILSEGVAGLARLAVNASLDSGKFLDCMASKRTVPLVEKYLSEGKQVGVYGTPTFFFNNRSAVGPLDVENFQKFASGQPFAIQTVFDDGACPAPLGALK